MVRVNRLGMGITIVLAIVVAVFMSGCSKRSSSPEPQMYKVTYRSYSTTGEINSLTFVDDTGTHNMRSVVSPWEYIFYAQENDKLYLRSTASLPEYGSITTSIHINDKYYVAERRRRRFYHLTTSRIYGTVRKEQ